MIDAHTIDKIFNASDIYEVVGDFISLKKRGVNYLGLCPFHNEKTPSFTVSPAKGIYKCFGCGKGGNSVNFIMDHEQLSYPEALKYLAAKYHIHIEEKPLTEEEIKQKDERESLLVITKFAQTNFSENLYNHKEGKAIGLSYFKERGFTDEIIEKFKLGYSINANDAFSHVATKQGYKLNIIEKTGLIIQKNTAVYDRFKGRVMFPIFSMSGTVIGFGGRILTNDKKAAKYLNSPESEIYHKSKVLYGLNFAKSTIVKKDNCIIVEGYTDVISMHQVGVENVISSSGTSLTVDQIKLVKRFTNNVTVMFDGDAAGIKASLRGIDLILQEGINVKVILLPDGEDPDSFSKKLKLTELEKYITENSKDFIKFKTELLLKETASDPINRAKVINNIVDSISLIPDNITRSVYIKECSNLLKIKEETIYQEVRNNILNRTKLKQPLSEIKDKPLKKELPEVPKFINKTFSEYEEKEIIYYLLKYGNNQVKIENEGEEQETTVAKYIINEIISDDLELRNLVYKQIFEESRACIIKNEEISTKHFTNHQDNKISGLAASLLSPQFELSDIHKRNGTRVPSELSTLSSDITKMILVFKSKIIASAISDIYIKMRSETDQEKLQEYLKLIIILNEQKVLLSNHLDRPL